MSLVLFGDCMKVFFLLLISALVFSCDGGLEPPRTPVQVETGTMTGLITYQHWPPLDSLKDLRLVAFRNFPPRDIITEVLQGQAMVHPPTALVPFFVDSLRFTFTLPVGTYKYVAIAQQFGPTITTDWRAVGQYDLDSNLTVPSPVIIVLNDTTRDININVDFANPPPPPF